MECELVNSWSGRFCSNIATKLLNGKNVCTFHYNKLKDR